WMRIYEANRSTLSSRVKEDPRMLVAGQVLHIPPKAAGGGQSPAGKEGDRHIFAPKTAQK
ncbi:MAG TPA: hypothetical protein VHE81_07375, partial [Lacipirellulaceae bacterium]|nr:hypothetical protein [Lacipirellulaceae bacterium]